jgi:N-hydroxyarylamine O-acetyltransferase
MNLDDYLARIGLSGPPAPDLAGLTAVQRAHRRAIPFENLDIPLGRVISLDPDALVAKLVTARRGGYCFEQNGLFLAALRALGFEARPLLARVWLFATDVPPKTHTLALVNIDSAEWIADAGFGGSDVPPLRLRDGESSESAGAFHALVRDPEHGWMLLRNGERQYSFTEEPVYPADLALANHWVATHPDSRFVRGRFVSMVRDDGLDTLSAEGAEPAAYRAALSERFGIALTDEEVARLLA